jgi:hypothetical protein
MAVEGFNPLLDISDFSIEGTPISTYWPDFRYALTNAIIQRTISGTSTLTLQLTDPTRAILNAKAGDGNYVLRHGLQVSVDNLDFMLAQFVKASDQAQLVFESNAIFHFRSLTNGNSTQITTNGTINQFFQQLIDQCNATFGTNYTLNAADYNQYSMFLVAGTTVNLSSLTGATSQYTRGSTVDTSEDSWTAMQRVASGVGWRCWESSGVIYLGPDEYWLGYIFGPNGVTKGDPPINTTVGHLPPDNLYEFTTGVQLMDYDWDIGKPFGNATVTCMLDFLRYQPGEVINLNNIGPASGPWIVNTIQRDLFLAEGTITCQIPMPSNSMIIQTLTTTGRPLL